MIKAKRKKKSVLYRRKKVLPDNLEDMKMKNKKKRKHQNVGFVESGWENL
jgi:hypothetical protein